MHNPLPPDHEPDPPDEPTDPTGHPLPEEPEEPAEPTDPEPPTDGLADQVQITATAVEGSPYRVVVDGVELLGGHTTKHKAQERATNEKLRNLEAEVHYAREERVMIGAAVVSTGGGVPPKKPETTDPLSAGSIQASVESATSYSATGTAAFGGVGAISYQWHESQTSGFTPGVGTEIDGATSQNLAEQTGKTEGVTYYLVRVATDEGAGSEASPQASVTPTSATPLVLDDFETGDKSYTAGGEFRWTGGAGVVTDAGQARSGSFAMRMSVFGEANIENRFEIMTADPREFWSDQWVWIPSDYHMTGGQQKFGAFWGEEGATGYGQSGRPKVVIELRNGDIDGDSKFRFLYNIDGSTISSQVGSLVNAVTDSGPFLRGQWNRFRQHVNMGTGAGTDDGTWKVWVNDTVVADFTGLSIWPTTETVTHFNWGYVLGYKNSPGYDYTHDFYYDDWGFFTVNPGWV